MKIGSMGVIRVAPTFPIENTEGQVVEMSGKRNSLQQGMWSAEGFLKCRGEYTVIKCPAWHMLDPRISSAILLWSTDSLEAHAVRMPRLTAYMISVSIIESVLYKIAKIASDRSGPERKRWSYLRNPVLFEFR